MECGNDMGTNGIDSRRPAVAPVNLPARISPDGGQDGVCDGVANGSLSARRPQSARVGKSQRPNSARAASQFRRTYSLPPGPGGISAYRHPGYYHGTNVTPRGMGQYEEYGPGVGMAPGSPWAGGVQVPVFSPWGFDVGPWGPQGAYGVANMSEGMPRRSGKPTRIVFVGDLPKGVSDGDVQEAAAKYGAIRGLDATQREVVGGVFVMYYDLRHAEAAVKGLPGAIRSLSGEDGCQATACCMMPPVGAAGMENQGIIALPGCELGRSELRAKFAKFGEIRDVRRGGGRPQGPDWRVVEFFDTRDAERAMADARSRKGYPKVEYAPFSGLEPACPPVSPPPYPVYGGYPVPGPLGPKRDDSTALPGGLEAPSLNPPPPVWPVASMAMPAGGFGMWPYAMAAPAHPAGYARDAVQTTSGSMAEAGGAGEAAGEGGASGYALPQSCRADYYCGPQYMGYPTGMPTMLPFGPGGQPLMMPTAGMYDASLMARMRPEMPTSPVHAPAASETHAWRPHRTGRGAGERSYDPAQFQFSLDEARAKSTNARTTLMIRNIPNKYSQKMLLDVLDRKYSGRYDFFYLPIDFKNRCNLGYAFVNFKTPATTAEFYKEFHSKSWEEFNSKKVCEITYARVQGRNALIEHFRNSRFPCNEPDYLPLVFEAVDEADHGKKNSQPVTKATPVHHWTTMHYPNNAAVAAH